MIEAPTFSRDLLKQLQEVQDRRYKRSLARAHPPEYNVEDASDIDLLFSSSTPGSFHIGTGASIYEAS